MVDIYNVIYLFIYVIGIGDKSLPMHSNKITGKDRQSNRQSNNFNLQVLE